MDKKREVPIKNYFILLIVSIITVLLTIYINEWIKTYKQSKISTSPLVDCISEVSFDDLDVVLSESNKIILYIGYTGDKEIYNFEKKLVKQINKNNINDYVYYLDITEYVDNNEYINRLNEKFNFGTEKIRKAPMFIYFKNGEVTAIKESNRNMITSKNLLDMIDMFDIMK